jgi:hypothetical protein
MTAPGAAAKAPLVDSLRRHIFRHRRLAGWLVALALLMKILIPAGFMPSMAGGTMTVELCTGQGVQTVEIAIPGQSGLPDEKSHEKAAPCTFSGLSAPMLGGVDPILLALAIAFIVATVFRAAPTPLVARRTWLTPPLRGPPLHI